MALEMNTIGVQLKYCIGSGTTRPTTSYVTLPDIKELPSIESNPSQLEVTNLTDTHKRFIPGVVDSGSAFDVTANMTAALKTAWNSMVDLSNTAWGSGNATWFEIAIPNFDSFYFAGRPSELGASQIGVDAVLEATLHIIPNQIGGWASAST